MRSSDYIYKKKIKKELFLDYNYRKKSVDVLELSVQILEQETLNQSLGGWSFLDFPHLQVK